MKQLKLIILIIAFSFIGIGLVNATQPADTKNEPTTTKTELQQEGKKEADKNSDSEETLLSKDEVEVIQDSLEDSSVSKYNFIFHFLYKFKYDQTEKP